MKKLPDNMYFDAPSALFWFLIWVIVMILLFISFF